MTTQGVPRGEWGEPCETTANRGAGCTLCAKSGCCICMPRSYLLGRDIVSVSTFPTRLAKSPGEALDGVLVLVACVMGVLQKG